jgi:hypothetical protein
MRNLACYEKILKEMGSFLCLSSVADFVKSSSGTRTSRLISLVTEEDDSDDLPVVQEEVPPS